MPWTSLARIPASAGRKQNLRGAVAQVGQRGGTRCGTRGANVFFRVERSRGFGRRGTRRTAPEGDALGEESPRRRFADGPDEPRGVRRRGGCEQQRHREDDACPHGPCPTRSERVSHRARGSPKRGARRAMPSRARLGPRGDSHQPRNLAASLERAVLCLPGRGEASRVVTRHVLSAPETSQQLSRTTSIIKGKFHPRKLRSYSTVCEPGNAADGADPDERE